MSQSKSQTATEYLILLAVVIVIALIVIGVLGGIPSIGGGASKSVSLAELGSKKIGVVNYGFQEFNAKFKLRNNLPNTVVIQSLWVDQNSCGFSAPDFPFQLNVGESKTVTCDDLNLNDAKFNNLVIEYKNLDMDAEFNTGGGLSNEVFKGVVLTNCFDNVTDANPSPICTCEDLDNIRYHLTWNYALQNNIDFAECDSSYTSGSGWDPIGGDFRGKFDGQDYSIMGLYISRSGEDDVGLFASATIDFFIKIKNLNLIDVDILGNNSVGGFVGSFNRAVISDCSISGSIEGQNNVGSFVGNGYCQSLDNSFANSHVSGASNVGGLIGIEPGCGGDFTNSGFKGTVSGSSHVGGLVGTNLGANMVNCYSYSEIENPGTLTGGLVGNGGAGVSSFWYNSSTDDAVSCYSDTGNIGCGTCSSEGDCASQAGISPS